MGGILEEDDNEDGCSYLKKFIYMESGVMLSIPHISCCEDNKYKNLDMDIPNSRDPGGRIIIKCVCYTSTDIFWD